MTMAPEIIAALATLAGVTGAVVTKLVTVWHKARKTERDWLKDASAGSVKQLEAWLEELRGRLESCHEKHAQTLKDMSHLQEQVDMLRAQVSQQQRLIDQLKATLVRDYARRPDSVPPRFIKGSGE